MSGILWSILILAVLLLVRWERFMRWPWGALMARWSPLVAVIVHITACPPGYTREACGRPGTHFCKLNWPRYCSPSGQTTDVGNMPCGANEHCSINSAGISHCAPGAPAPEPVVSLSDGGVSQ